MKTKSFITGLIAIGLIASLSAFKVDICHNVDNNPHVINISLPAAVMHLLKHEGDKLGSCVVYGR